VVAGVGHHDWQQQQQQHGSSALGVGSRHRKSLILQQLMDEVQQDQVSKSSKVS
jgi:hypothetical protein